MDGMAGARPQIESHGTAAAFEILQSLHVSLGQIVHVDLIAHTGTVRRRVLVSEDLECRTLTADGFESRRDEVGLRLVNLANSTFFVRSRGVEIAKTYVAQTVRWSIGLQRLFENQF